MSMKITFPHTTATLFLPSMNCVLVGFPVLELVVSIGDTAGGNGFLSRMTTLRSVSETLLIYPPNDQLVVQIFASSFTLLEWARLLFDKYFFAFTANHAQRRMNFHSFNSTARNDTKLSPQLKKKYHKKLEIQIYLRHWYTPSKLLSLLPPTIMVNPMTTSQPAHPGMSLAMLKATFEHESSTLRENCPILNNIPPLVLKRLKDLRFRIQKGTYAVVDQAPGQVFGPYSLVPPRSRPQVQPMQNIPAADRNLRHLEPQLKRDLSVYGGQPAPQRPVMPQNPPPQRFLHGPAQNQPQQQYYQKQQQPQLGILPPGTVSNEQLWALLLRVDRMMQLNQQNMRVLNSNVGNLANGIILLRRDLDLVRGRAVPPREGGGRNAQGGVNLYDNANAHQTGSRFQHGLKRKGSPDPSPTPKLKREKE
ncbi:uncharacterized protein BDR25DRAFT_351986 [Lindgomyces ingoldianus]|uniref:Uncharacterized protein n=1 Tax=Lindgomyces ingoldianus TaxID=673940 RepID=A0ACB6R578_9PLEO|nr:uncharacterized protein BDR25DRAFT_351986 [Lindgomyces ingoldianus]KAF2474433.1 hypothetical protein BDR25DRAFT_351986 [Lindgomyces ingoldianus]